MGSLVNCWGDVAVRRVAPTSIHPWLRLIPGAKQKKIDCRAKDRHWRGPQYPCCENWGITQTHIDRRGLGYEMDHSFLAAPAWWMMQISAKVLNQNGNHQSIVRTGEKAQTLTIPPKAEGLGSGVNGGELLFLALATCYCNDVYREAKNRGLDVESVEVEIVGQFGSKGEPAENITYRVSVKAKGREKEVLDLMRYTDSVVEIHNTVRRLSYSPYVGLSKQSRQREAAHRVSSLSLPSLIRCSGALFQTVRTHT